MRFHALGIRALIICLSIRAYAAYAHSSVTKVKKERKGEKRRETEKVKSE